MTKKLELKRISSKEIDNIVELLGKGCHYPWNPEEHEAVAQAQLQTDQQVLDNVKQAIFDDFEQKDGGGHPNWQVLKKKWLK